MADASAQRPALTVTADVDGNLLTLLTEGPERLEALIGLIEGAQETLRVLYYMFLDDQAGRRVRDALLAAAERGVRVSLLVDGFGSDAAKDPFFKPLVDGKVHFCRFQPRLGRRYLLRNHQKLALADEKIVLSGGFNVSDEYFGEEKGGAWRDLGLQVEGPSVRCLAGYFDDLFAWTRKPGARIRELRRMLNKHSEARGALRWQFGGPARRLSPWARSVRKDMIHAARLDMVAAYFSPSRNMLRRIKSIAARGRARIVTASKSDNNTTIGAARYTYWRLLRRGVEIYEYQPTKLHTKLIVIDDVVHIGSANFDMRSLYLNLEMMLRVEDRTFAQAMHRYVDGEIAASTRITLELHRQQRSLFNRLRWAIAHFIVTTMDYNVSRRLNFGLDGR
jgi:cardiolipin synthase A/B